MREHLSYRVTVGTENAKVFDNLIDWLTRSGRASTPVRVALTTP